MSISQGFGDVRARARQGVPGGWVYSDPTRVSGFGLNSYPQTAQVGTIVVDTATNSATYTWTINGVELTYTADSSTSATEVGDGIVAAIDAEPLVRGQVSASNNAGTVTLTATTPGVAFTASDSDAKLTTTEETTAADTADAIAFGRALIYDGRNTNGASSGNTEIEELVALPVAAQFTAQIIHVTPTFVDTAEFTISLYEIRGAERVFIASATSTSATSVAVVVDNMVTAVNAAMPAATVVATDGTTHLILTAEVPGVEWDVVVHATTMGATAPTAEVAYNTGPDETTSLHRAWRGISLYSPSSEATTVAGTEGSYGPNEGVHYARRGVVWVTNTESPGTSDTVYVETASGASTGKLYASSSATRIALARSRAQWERAGVTSSDSLAAVRLET